MDRQNRYACIFTLIFIFIQLYMALGYIKKGKYYSLIGLVCFTLLFLAYIFVQLKFRINMSPYIIFFVLLSIVSNHLVGEYMGLYYSSNIYDKLLHVIGTYAFSLFTYSIITHFFPEKSISIGHELIYIIVIGAALGMLFELFEFFTDISMKPEVPNQTNLNDTDIDMIADIIGAGLAALHAWAVKFRIFGIKV